MRKICLLLSLILTMIFICACGNASANGDISENQTMNEDTYKIDGILDSTVEGYQAGRCFYSQKEFEDYLRQDDGSLPSYYIPWQTIWSIGELDVVAWPDLYIHSYTYDVFDEFGNRYYISVVDNPKYYYKNVWEIYYNILDPTTDESAEPVMLREYLTSDRIDTIEIPSGTYVEDIDDPNQLYYYKEDGRLEMIAFKTGNFMIVIQMALAETTDDSMNSISTVNKIPQIFTSYSKLQASIENIRGNVAQYVTKYEATE